MRELTGPYGGFRAAAAAGIAPKSERARAAIRSPWADSDFIGLFGQGRHNARTRTFLRPLAARACARASDGTEDVALQILALNTEKAHDLKERSLEVIRMYRGFVGARGNDEETAFAAIFEEPHVITFGAAYAQRPRFSPAHTARS